MRRRPDDLRDSLAIAATLLGRPDLRIGRPPEEAHWLLAHAALTNRRPQRVSDVATMRPAASGFHPERWTTRATTYPGLPRPITS